jgi:hypothetical protein
MNNNGLLWVTKEDDFSSIDFLDSLLGQLAPHPIGKLPWEVFFFL